MEITDPAEPLFGKRFRLESISRGAEEATHVFLRREDGIVLRVPKRATDLSVLVDHAPRAKLSQQAVAEFLDLVKEYELCPPPQESPRTNSGRRSTKSRNKKS